MKRLVMFLLIWTSAALAQQGAFLYHKHCALCHASPQGHAPAYQSLHAMSETALLRAMETGTMREQAKAMNGDERKTLAAYLSSGNVKAVSAIRAAAFCKDSSTPINFSATSNCRFKPSFGLSGAVPTLERSAHSPCLAKPCELAYS